MEPHWSLYYSDHQYQHPLVNSTPHVNQPSASGGNILLQQQLRSFWEIKHQESEYADDFRNHSLPLARIKKIMKSDDNVRMISADAPVLLARACEMFIQDLSLRSWRSTEESKRKRLQKADISAALSTTDLFDFLVDLVPREKPLSSAMPLINLPIISSIDNANSSLGAIHNPQHLQQPEGCCLGDHQAAAGLTMGVQMQLVQDDHVDGGGYNSTKNIQGGWPNCLAYQPAWPPPDF